MAADLSKTQELAQDGLADYVFRSAACLEAADLLSDAAFYPAIKRGLRRFEFATNDLFDFLGKVGSDGFFGSA